MKSAKYILAIFFIFTIASCSKTIGDSSTDNTTTTAYTGEQLFRGIFFFQGDIPSKIASFAPIKEGLDKISIDKKVQQDKFVDKMVGNIMQLSPTYFNELSSAVASKNNYSIDESMQKGAQLIDVALTNTDEYKQFLKIPNDAFASIDYSKYNLSKQADLNKLLVDINGKLKTFSKSESSTNLVCVAVAAVVVLAVWDAVAAVNYGAVVNAAALALVYAAVYAKVVFWGPKESAEQGLQRELIINDIANLQTSTNY